MNWLKDKWNRFKKWIIGLFIIPVALASGVGVVDNQIDPYIDKGTHFELAIEADFPQGERVEIAKDKAEITLIGWNDEYAISIEPIFKSGNKPTGNRPLFSKRVVWKDGDIEVFIEPRNSKEFDIDFTLNKKPKTNVFEYRVTGAEDFDFFYQSPLTQEKIDEGNFMPENVVGSYAVYHKTKRNNCTNCGTALYSTGKIMHIYRPKAIDADGSEVWAILDYSNDILSVTVPQSFLDVAVYPVRVDPTFGYTTLGSLAGFVGCGASTNLSVTFGMAFNLSIDGTLDSIHTSILTDDGDTETADLFLALYREDSEGSGSHAFVAGVEDLDHTIDNIANFELLTANDENLSADDYIITGLCNGADLVDGATDYSYDDTSDINSYTENTAGDGSYSTRKSEDPWTKTVFVGGFTASFFVTYTGEVMPIVLTSTSTAITDTNTTMHGEITQIGDVGSIEVGFEYGIDTFGGDLGFNATTTTLTATTSIGSYSEGITGLTTFEEYGFRAWAAASTTATTTGNTFQFFTADTSTSTPVVIADNHAWDLGDFSNGSTTSTTGTTVLSLTIIPGEGHDFATTTYDSFTGSNATHLDAHTPDTGTGWTKEVTISAGDLELWGGHLEADNARASSGVLYSTQPDPPYNDYTVQWKHTDTDAGLDDPYHLIVHYIDSSNWYGVALYGGDAANDVVLYKNVGGTRTSLATDSTNLALNDVFRFEVATSTQKVYKNGVLLLSAADTTVVLQNAGKAGVGVGALRVSTDDMVFTADYDDFYLITGLGAGDSTFEDGAWTSPSWTITGVDFVDDSWIEFSSTTPSDTTVTVQVAVNSDGGTQPAEGDFTTVTSGGNMSAGGVTGDLTGKFVWVRIELGASTDNADTPTVTQLIMGINDGEASVTRRVIFPIGN